MDNQLTRMLHKNDIKRIFNFGRSKQTDEVYTKCIQIIHTLMNWQGFETKDWCDWVAFNKEFRERNGKNLDYAKCFKDEEYFQEMVKYMELNEWKIDWSNYE